MSSTTTDFRRRDRGGFRSAEAHDYDSTPSLLRRLADDVGTLFAQEVALLKAETAKSICDLKALYGLSNVMQPWLAVLIVGGVVTLIGLVTLAAGRRKLAPASFTPDRTAAALRKDAQMIKGVSQHEHD